MPSQPLSLLVSRVIALEVLRAWRKRVEREPVELRFHWPLRGWGGVGELRRRLAGQQVLAVRVLVCGPQLLLSAEETTDADWQAFVVDGQGSPASQGLNLVQALDLVRHIVGPLTHVSALGTAKGQNDPLTRTPSALVVNLHAEDQTVGQLVAGPGPRPRGELEVFTPGQHYRLNWVSGVLDILSSAGVETQQFASAEGLGLGATGDFADGFPSLAAAWAIVCALTNGQLTTVPRA